MCAAAALWARTRSEPSTTIAAAATIPIINRRRSGMQSSIAMFPLAASGQPSASTSLMRQISMRAVVRKLTNRRDVARTKSSRAARLIEQGAVARNPVFVLSPGHATSREARKVDREGGEIVQRDEPEGLGR